VQDVVDKAVAKSKFKGKFTHGIGHSIGLATHDGIGFAYPPGIVLKENMVLTVEPGLYLSGWGGVRIEDDIVVKKNGYELLTTASRKLAPVT
jgi:Xaa-Pro dipeptidase